MNKRCVKVCAVLAMLFVTSKAVSSSMSCVTINGEQKCSYKNDLDGNSAAAVAATNGFNGAAASGAGTPDNFQTDYQQIGQGNFGNGDTPVAGVGIDGPGQPFNPNSLPIGPVTNDNGQSAMGGAVSATGPEIGPPGTGPAVGPAIATGPEVGPPGTGPGVATATGPEVKPPGTGPGVGPGTGYTGGPKAGSGPGYPFNSYGPGNNENRRTVVRGGGYPVNPNFVPIDPYKFMQAFWNAWRRQ